METDIVTIGLPVVIAVSGALAGYFGRRAQKIEDQMDDIFLNELPGIVSSSTSFINSLDVYKETGSFEQLTSDITTISGTIKGQVFSGNIILSDPELYKILLNFYRETEKLKNILEGIKNEGDEEKRKERIQVFYKKFDEKKDYLYSDKLSINVSKIADDVRNLDLVANNKFQQYTPFSWKLLVLIAIIGMLLGIIEVFKLFIT
ncbi:MAG: hypothetical protein ABFC78_08085 [Methanoregula sp.]